MPPRGAVAFYVIRVVDGEWRERDGEKHEERERGHKRKRGLEKIKAIDHAIAEPTQPSPHSEMVSVRATSCPT
jgi:hypothetical protein